MANLTLSVADELLKKARIHAIEHGTSVNALVREYLQSLTDQTQDRMQALEEIEALAQKIERERLIESGWKWNRDEIYEDRFNRPISKSAR